MRNSNRYSAILNTAMNGDEIRREKATARVAEVQLAKGEKLKVITAIEELKLRVTAADVATKTGIELHVAQRLLNQVAAETGGTLQVSYNGTIAYKFQPSFRNAYLAQGIKRVALQTMSTIALAMLWAFKVSFGVVLITSMVFIAIVVVLVTVALLILAADGSSDSDSGSSDSSDLGVGRLFDGCTNIFIWDSSPTYTYDHHKPCVKQGNGFLSDVFSFLFGAGNPNAYLEGRKWQYVASVIQRNNGVVIPELLWPYIGREEKALLSVLVRFNGVPVVTEQGTIIYRFPDLRQTASEVSLLKEPPVSLHEFMLKFSEADCGGIIALAAFNFIGAWWLWSSLPFVKTLLIMVLHLSASVVSSLTWIAPVLVVYGTLFVVIPIVRAAVNWVINQRIESRNEKRDQCYRMLKMPSTELKNKLAEVASLAIEQTKVSEANLAYRTDEGLLEQTFQQEEIKRTAQEIVDNVWSQAKKHKRLSNR
jgi:hypothetical protein